MTTLVVLFLAACSGGAAAPEAPAPTPVVDTKAPEPVVPAADPAKETSVGFAIGVKKIAADRAELQSLLDSDKLADLHKTAERISETAKALPSTCESLGDAQRADVATQAQKLQDLFKGVDEAGDAGKKVESAAAIKEYDAPIAALSVYLP